MIHAVGPTAVTTHVPHHIYLTLILNTANIVDFAQNVNSLYHKL